MDIEKKLTAELGEGWVWDARDLAILHLADRTADTINRLEVELESSGLVVPGSEGQPRVSPLVAEIRLQRGSLAQLLGKLAIPGDEPQKSATHQAAANARWDRVRRNHA
jgi:hypothetical protein